MYPDSNSQSAQLFRRAQESLPGGNTRHAIYYPPYPIYAQKAEGCRVTDVDGVERIDCVNNMSALLHGHGNEKIVSAVRDQLGRMTSIGMPTETEVDLAELICSRVPSVERVRFMNSGSEATLFAMRLARAHTGRDKIAKIEGGYNGNPDALEISLSPRPHEWGPDDAPNSVPATRGIPDSAAHDTVVLPLNDIVTAVGLIEENRDDLAAVILEPVVTKLGFLEASQDYLNAIREATKTIGALLIFDEIFCFRLGVAGVQGGIGVTPDLTTFGKVIGGGFPIGAVGGSSNIMDLFDPEQGSAGVEHAGTFNGGPITMVAGRASLEQFNEDTLEHLDELGRRLRENLSRIIEDNGIPAQVTGMSSLNAIHFFTEEYSDYRTYSAANREHDTTDKAGQFHKNMLNNGVLIVPRGALILSTAMEQADIDSILEATERSLRAIVQD